MDLFVYIGRDGPRGAELRGSVRERHLAHLEGLVAAGRIRYAGPLRNDAGDPCGSLIVLEAESLADAKAIAQSDPYNEEGVFETVEVFASAQVFPAA